MSMSAALDYIKAAVQTIASPGAAATLACIEGIPHEGIPADIAQFPLCVLTVQTMDPEMVGFGVSGQTLEHYAVQITVFLGPKDMAHDQAVSWAKLFPGRFRAKFTPDWKLGGNCMDSNLRGPIDNLKIQESGNALYEDAQQFPMIGWDLMVDESTTANAVAP